MTVYYFRRELLNGENIFIFYEKMYLFDKEYIVFIVDNLYNFQINGQGIIH